MWKAPIIFFVFNCYVNCTCIYIVSIRVICANFYHPPCIKLYIQHVAYYICPPNSASFVYNACMIVCMSNNIGCVAIATFYIYKLCDICDCKGGTFKYGLTTTSFNSDNSPIIITWFVPLTHFVDVYRTSRQH